MAQQDQAFSQDDLILRQEQAHQSDLANALDEDVPDVSKLPQRSSWSVWQWRVAPAFRPAPRQT